ncbi:MAG: hypothetical protein M0Z53_04355 [Thermaerobacter sp.]|nr:hypothetical protein [Thermaerobacter sp.]
MPIDQHSEVDHVYYSVPYPRLQQNVAVRSTLTTVEILARGERVASHPRHWRQGTYVTVPEHRPPPHRHYLEWTPERLANWGAEWGPDVKRWVEELGRRRPHPEQADRAGLGLFRLARQYPERINRVCANAWDLGMGEYRHLKTWLQTTPAEAAPSAPLPEHRNIRGAADYQPNPTEDSPLC